VSGPDALAVGDRIVRLKRGQRLAEVPGWSVALGEAVDPANGTILDEVIAVVMRRPRSYTGEDVLEIQCHGGRLMAEKILALALAGGACPAEAGEFTRRAFLSGRITLEEAEAVLDLVNAPSESSLRAAGRRLKGELGARIRGWEARLFGILAAFHAAADFPEDVGDQVIGPMKELVALRDEARALLDRAPLGLALVSGIEVCLVGRPNAGKSSLFNALLGEDRAIVTVVPGTTRDVLRERTEWRGLPVVLLDTAGLCETSDVVETIGVERARSAATEAEVILYVVDDTVGLTGEDAGWISRWRDRKMLVVVNKVDKGAGRVAGTEVTMVAGHDWLRVCAVTKEGLEQVKDRVLGWFSAGGAPESAVPGSARQVDCLRRAVQAMEQAVSQGEIGWTEDVVVLSLEEAARAFAALTGREVSKETLDRVFSRFCVGK
jgi:tRNA modification GTPase